MLCLAYFHVFDSPWYSARAGSAERDLLLSEEKSFVHLMDGPGVYAWWEANPYSFLLSSAITWKNFVPNEIQGYASLGN